MVYFNSDAGKEAIQSDCVEAYMTFVKLLIKIGSFLGFIFGTVDLKGADMLIGPITRAVYVPLLLKEARTVSLVLNAPYGLLDAGRQYTMKVES